MATSIKPIFRRTVARANERLPSEDGGASTPCRHVDSQRPQRRGGLHWMNAGSKQFSMLLSARDRLLSTQQTMESDLSTFPHDTRKSVPGRARVAGRNGGVLYPFEKGHGQAPGYNKPAHLSVRP